MSIQNALNIIRHIDILNDEIDVLNAKKQRLYLELKDAKNIIIKENSSIIGRTAKLNPCGLAKCTGLHLSDTLEVVPEFSYGSRKLEYISYEWYD